MDKLARDMGQIVVGNRLIEGLQSLQGLGKDVNRMIHAGLHGWSPVHGGGSLMTAGNRTAARGRDPVTSAGSQSSLP